MMLIYLVMKDIDFGINATNNKKNLKNFDKTFSLSDAL